MKDLQNQIWIATFNGILQVPKKGNQIIKSNRFNNLPANSIYSLFTDSQNGAWIGTWLGGLAYLNPNENRFLHIQQASAGNSTEGSVVSSFTEDLDGKIWIGSENGVDCFDQNSGAFTNLTKSAGLAGNNVYGIPEDEQYFLWFSTENGISC
ncbi:MAG: two-component regulator propeller domain-containing protein [Prolixibacteraceae bacterium]